MKGGNEDKERKKKRKTNRRRALKHARNVPTGANVTSRAALAILSCVSSSFAHLAYLGLFSSVGSVLSAAISMPSWMAIQSYQ